MPPGFEAAIDSASDTGKANGQGLGLGKIPPGFINFVSKDSPDDYWESHYESGIGDDYEGSYDGTNKGHVDGKGLFGKFQGKNGGFELRESKSGGNPGCSNKGIAGAFADVVGSVLALFTVEGYTAVGNGCGDATNLIRLGVIAPNGTTNVAGNPPAYVPAALIASQPFSFTPDTNGDWEVRFAMQSFTATRTITVSDGVTADAGTDRTGVPVGLVTHSGSSGASVGTVTYSWEITNIPGGPPVILVDNDPLDGDIEFTTLAPHSGRTFELTLTVRDDNGWASDIVLITIS